MKTPPDADTTYLYLIRHAATDANRQRPQVLQGRGINKSLNEAGRRQAAALGEFLAGFTIQHVYSSPMLRAVETAREIADRRGHKIVELPDLAEVDVGRWEGLDWGTIMRDFPDDYRVFMEDAGRNPYLGGESYRDVQNRVRPQIQSLLEKHCGETIAVVAHNVVNRVYLAALLATDLRHAKGIRQTNTGINLIRHRRGETELLTLNAHFHLDGLPAD